MNKKTLNALQRYSFPLELINRIAENKHTTGVLKLFSSAVLKTFYNSQEVRLIERKLKRKAIPSDVQRRILLECSNTCAFCGDGNNSGSLHLHHIVPYEDSQDNSVENLFPVCPTHHDFIHSQNISPDEQKRKRAEWNSILTIASQYEKRKISFPYKGCFLPIVYSHESDILEILSLKQPTPGTAVVLSENQLGFDGSSILIQNGILLIVGESGSGKSTLALGIAGSKRFEHRFVFRYRTPHKSHFREALPEIMTFIQVCTIPCILVIDDANTWASTEEIEQICNATNSTKCSVIITCTSTFFGNDPSIERLLCANRITLNWLKIQPFIVSILLKNETIVVEKLKAMRVNANHNVGHSVRDEELSTLIERYIHKAKSVWQFLYLLQAGWKSIGDDLTRLVTEDRADIPVVYAAIEQIARVEAPVTVAESAFITNRVLVSACLPAATESWIESVYEELVSQRKFSNVRDSFTTAHRDWAAELINCSLGNKASRITTAIMLEEYFSSNTKNIREMLILWSWMDSFVHNESSLYIREWFCKQRGIHWEFLIHSAAEKGITEIGLLSEYLHKPSFGKKWESMISTAFEKNQTVLVSAVTNIGSTDWYYLRWLFTCLNSVNKTLSESIIQQWEPNDFATILQDTDLIYYYSIVWFIPGVHNHSKNWCEAVGSVLDIHKLLQNLHSIPKGKANLIIQLADLLPFLGISILRSMVTTFSDAMAKVLTGATLSEIHLNDGVGMPSWLQYFPGEMKKIADSLDPKQLAADFSNSSPRYWSKMMSICQFSATAETSFADCFVAELNVEQLIDKIELFHITHPVNFMQLIWILGYGTTRVKAKYAETIYPFVYETALSHGTDERERLLVSYSELSQKQTKRLTKEAGWKYPEITDYLEEIDMPIWKSIQSEERVREVLDKLDSSGSDYDVHKYIWQEQITVD